MKTEKVIFFFWYWSGQSWDRWVDRGRDTPESPGGLPLSGGWHVADTSGIFKDEQRQTQCLWEDVCVASGGGSGGRGENEKSLLSVRVRPSNRVTSSLLSAAAAACKQAAQTLMFSKNTRRRRKSGAVAAAGSSIYKPFFTKTDVRETSVAKTCSLSICTSINVKWIFARLEQNSEKKFFVSVVPPK